MTSALSLTLSGCSFDESGLSPEPEGPAEGVHKVSIYSDIHQQPATKVTTDGFCIGDQVGVYIVNYDGDMPGELKLVGNQADNVRFTYDENGNCYDVDYICNQSADTPWTVGNTYDATIYVLGYEATVSVSIIDTPVKSVEFAPMNIIRNTKGWISQNYE